MKTFTLFHKVFGKPEMRIFPPDSYLNSTVGKIDEDLHALWREDGWASYAEGLFWTVDPRDFATLSADWDGIPNMALTFGRTAFGDLFLLHKGEVFMLIVQANNLVSLGPSVYNFLNSTLAMPKLRQTFLDNKLFESIRKRVGNIAHDECYGLFPALPLGGNDDDPSAYRRVKLREYLALLSQIHH